MKDEFVNEGFSDGPQIGVIAQEVEKVYPELVHTSKETGYKSVDYSRFAPILIEAIQEQQEVITEKAREVDNLKSEVEALNSENEQMKLELQNIKKMIEELRK